MIDGGLFVCLLLTKEVLSVYVMGDCMLLYMEVMVCYQAVICYSQLHLQVSIKCLWQFM